MNISNLVPCLAHEILDIPKRFHSKDGT